MAKKFEHLDVLANLVSGSGLDSKISIHRYDSGGEWVMYHPLKKTNVKAPSLSALNLLARDDLNYLAWELIQKGYGKKAPVVKKKKVEKKKKGKKKDD
jgi:hypothetical protein